MSSENHNMVVVRTFPDTEIAHIYKARLESEQIQVALLNDNSDTVLPLGASSLGEVQLCVNEADAAAALQIIAEMDSNETEEA
jgi:hypothetical protein